MESELSSEKVLVPRNRQRPPLEPTHILLEPVAKHATRALDKIEKLLPIEGHVKTQYRAIYDSGNAVGYVLVKRAIEDLIKSLKNDWRDHCPSLVHRTECTNEQNVIVSGIWLTAHAVLGWFNDISYGGPSLPLIPQALYDGFKISVSALRDEYDNALQNPEAPTRPIDAPIVFPLTPNVIEKSEARSRPQAVSKTDNNKIPPKKITKSKPRYKAPGCKYCESANTSVTSTLPDKRKIHCDNCGKNFHVSKSDFRVPISKSK
jgi:hypothetical protein